MYLALTQLCPAPPGLPVSRIPTGTPAPLRKQARSLLIGTGEIGRLLYVYACIVVPLILLCVAIVLQIGEL